MYIICCRILEASWASCNELYSFALSSHIEGLDVTQYLLHDNRYSFLSNGCRLFHSLYLLHEKFNTKYPQCLMSFITNVMVEKNVTESHKYVLTYHKRMTSPYWIRLLKQKWKSNKFCNTYFCVKCMKLTKGDTPREIEVCQPR